MKKSIQIIATAFAILLGNVSFSQNDTMYVMKNGVVINKQPVNPNDVDSIVFYNPSSIDTSLINDDIIASQSGCVSETGFSDTFSDTIIPFDGTRNLVYSTGNNYEIQRGSGDLVITVNKDSINDWSPMSVSFGNKQTIDLSSSNLEVSLTNYGSKAIEVYFDVHSNNSLSEVISASSAGNLFGGVIAAGQKSDFNFNLATGRRHRWASSSSGCEGDFVGSYCLTDEDFDISKVSDIKIFIVGAGSSVDGVWAQAPLDNYDVSLHYIKSGTCYTSVRIGTQEWMTENLRTTKYSDGTTIPNVTVNTEWYNLSTGAWSHYNNKCQNEATCGKLYNWYAVETGKLCPTDWHLPTDEEWTVLTNYLAANGHSGKEGTALKATSFWSDTDLGAANGIDAFGWSGLPYGRRLSEWPGFVDPVFGFWWSSSETSANGAWYRRLDYDGDSVYSNISNKKAGFSVRCLRD